jgi:hypothetical protein
MAALEVPVLASVLAITCRRTQEPRRSTGSVSLPLMRIHCITAGQRTKRGPRTSPGPSLCLSQQSAPGGIRTPNLLIRNQMLYPLSYGRSAASGIPVRNVAKDYRLTLLRRKSASTPDRPAKRSRRQAECFNRGGTSLEGRTLGT